MLLFIRYSNVSPADLITTLLLNPEVKKYFLLFSPPSQFYQMQSEVANRSVQCNKFGAQSYKLWYKWHILTSYLSLIIMIDILLVNIAHTGRSDTSKIWHSDAMFETRRHKKKVGEEWRKNSGANALKS